MQPLVNDVLERLTFLHIEVAKAIGDLPLDALDWEPVADANAIGALVVHILGAERYWIETVIFGAPSERVREAEFAVRGIAAPDLLGQLEALDADLGRLLATLQLHDLDRSCRVARDGRDVRVGWVLAHVVEHTALHVGQIQLTAQLWRQRREGRAPRVLLVGSSIFEAWRDLPAQAPDFTVRNRAIGGTVTAHWRQTLADVLIEEQPDVVLFYCGSNDLNDVVPETEIVANTLACRAIVARALPAARFVYFGIIKAPQKLGRWDAIDRVHAAIRAELPARDLFIDTDPVFLSDGRPVEPFFVEDRLHLTPEAYAALAADAVPRISAWLTAR